MSALMRQDMAQRAGPDRSSPIKADQISPKDARLPDLRSELRLCPGEPMPDGAPSWLLFDPVRNCYHRLDYESYQRIKYWGDISVADYLSQLENALDFETCEDDVKTLVTFMYAQKLVTHPPGGDSEAFAAQEFAATPPLTHTLIHKYLFFRIPLIRPDRFLNAAYPWVQWIFTRAAMTIIGLIALTGLYFAARQWDVFVSTFLHFLTFEGLIYYGLTIAGLKIIHELGHAFTARHFGSRVPVMGLAFLVMFPILYTDTTNAWELTDRKKRVLIDAAGMIAELMVAAIALFLWSFLPEGPFRSAAFFAATTSWIFSLLVNLNPMMRFDGYYLLTDWFRAPNLQASGFEMGRWHMRETVFNLKEPCPEAVSAQRRKALILYAYCTWVYRFFLFIGIAILVHHLFPKALGIILFSVEIGWFIVKPIFKELKHWWSLRMKIIASNRGRGALIISCLLLAAACLPWHGTISAPAILRPSVQTEIYPTQAARLTTLSVHNGKAVKAGDILMTLTSERIDHEDVLAKRNLALIEAQLARRVSDAQDLSASSVLVSARQRELASLSALSASRDALIIRAPHDGIISDLPDALHIGRYISATDRLLRLINPQTAEIISFPKEDDAARLLQGAQITFIPDNLLARKTIGNVTSLSPTSESLLTEDILSSNFKGPIAVTDNDEGQSVPKTAMFRVRADIAQPMTDMRAVRGVAKIKVVRQAPIKSIAERAGQVLIRETDF